MSWQSRRSIRFWLVLVFLGGCGLACSAQEAVEEVAADEEEVVAPVPVSPAVTAALSAIERRNPQSLSEIVSAVNILRKLGAYEDARAYLSKLENTEQTLPKLAKVNAQIGSGELVGLANDPYLPEARTFVEQVFAAANKIIRDPGRLQQFVAQLSDDDAENRRLAILSLRQAGAHAVPALVAALHRGDVSLPKATYALGQLGAKAEDAIIALLGSPTDSLQLAAAAALRTSGTNRARIHLVRPALTGSDDLQQAAEASLQRLGRKVPGKLESAAGLLHRQAFRHLDGQPPFAADSDGLLEVWTWSAEDQNVVSHRLIPLEAAAVAAARLARDAYELKPSRTNAKLLLASQLQVDVFLGGMDDLLPREPGSAYDFGSTLDASQVSDVLDLCLTKRYDAAASGAAELLADLSVSEAVGERLPTFVRALRSPNRRVRYAAARGIMTVDPRTPFAGSSLLLDSLIELAEVSGSPRAIVTTARDDHRADLTSFLATLGFDVYQTRRSTDFIKEAIRISDYDIAFLSDTVHRPTVEEAVQQIRQDPQGKLLPVVLLAREDRARLTELVASLDNLVFVMPESTDEQTVTTRLALVEQSVQSFFVAPSRRIEQAKSALQWLGHFAKYSQTYPWYDHMRALDVAKSGTNVAALRPTSIRLLGSLGNAAAQQTLIDLASHAGHTIEDRQTAANAFAEAVLRRGLMLQSKAVHLQYARYNASETADKPTQDVLGQILDVIETQTKSTSITTVN